jgi:hypothetical protein
MSTHAPNGLKQSIQTDIMEKIHITWATEDERAVTNRVSAPMQKRKKGIQKALGVHTMIKQSNTLGIHLYNPTFS